MCERLSVCEVVPLLYFTVLPEPGSMFLSFGADGRHFHRHAVCAAVLHSRMILSQEIIS